MAKFVIKESKYYEIEAEDEEIALAGYRVWFKELQSDYVHILPEEEEYQWIKEEIVIKKQV